MNRLVFQNLKNMSEHSETLKLRNKLKFNGSPIHIPKEEDDNDMVIPSSPTDVMQSPCTSKLWGKRLNKKSPTENSFLHHKRSYSYVDVIVEYSNLKSLPKSIENQIILGSSSKNRKEVLDKIKWKYTQMSPDIDEKAIRLDNPNELPVVIAKAKAEAIINKLYENKINEEKIIITADQIVLYNDIEIREKPINESQAYEFLQSYSGNVVKTISAIVITHFPSLKQSYGIDIATIHWDVIPSNIITKVISKGDIFSSAGGFCIEDTDLNHLIKHIEGSVSSVFGMPLELTLRLIDEILL